MWRTAKREWSVGKNTTDIYAENKTKIPLVYGVDAIHGVTYTDKSTLFPQQIAQALTFNRSLVHRAARNYRLRIACGFICLEFFAGAWPWPRCPLATFMELSAKIPLASELATQITHGYRVPILTISTNFMWWLVPSIFWVILLLFREKIVRPLLFLKIRSADHHLPAFQAAVEAGVGSVMVNSGLVNGIPVHASHFLMTDLLKRIGFQRCDCYRLDGHRKTLHPRPFLLLPPKMPFVWRWMQVSIWYDSVCSGFATIWLRL